MLKTPPIRNKKCCICGKRVFSNKSIYCRTCSEFARRIKWHRFPAETVKAIWDYVRRYGYVCYYTGMLLDMDDPKSPWYCVFDHWIPGDPRKVVLTSSLINDMKTDMSEDEFWSIIRLLADHKRMHTKVRKIRLSYWGKDCSAENEGGLAIEVSQMVHTGRCYICGKRLLSKDLIYCPRCKKIAYRLHSQNKELPPETIEDIINYIRTYGFVCYYTGISLNLTDPKSPWYLVFDHWIPRNPGKVVITCSLINFMKSDLTEDEFWYYIEALADYKDKGKKIRKKRPAFWNRLYPA